MRTAVSYVLPSLAMVVGAAGMAAGEADDSPGLGGLGLLLIAGGAAYAVRAFRRRRRPAA